jgi:transcription initiation factor TFIIIB Brf1 subunit/transcription initiation factor TFIIB
MEDVSVDNVDELISCADCYAVVKKGDVEKHYEWHARAVRDAVAASVVVVSDAAEAADAAEPPSHRAEEPQTLA